MKRETVATSRPAVMAVLVVLTCAAAFGVAGIMGVRRDVFSASGLSYTLVASTSFVLLGALGVASRGGDRYGLLMLGGLVFCWLGDILGPRGFMLGLAAFLIAHCFLIAAFLSQGVVARKVRPALVFYAVIGLGTSAWLLPHVPSRDLIPVVAYMLVISAMAVSAFAIRVRRGGWMVAAAALLFYVSDIFVARWRFVAQDAINRLCCYPLYYAACVMLALSVYIVCRHRSEETAAQVPALE